MNERQEVTQWDEIISDGAFLIAGKGERGEGTVH